MNRDLDLVRQALKPVMCPDCQHAPIAHVEGYCIVCEHEVKKKVRNGATPCFHIFAFKLTKSEREQAMKASKTSYEQDDLCAMCGLEWMQHHGYLCPSGDSTFVLLFGGTGAHKII